MILAEKIALPPPAFFQATKKLTKKVLKKAYLGFFLLFIPISCTPSITKDQEILLLLDWFPNPNHVPLYVGIEKGFFKRKGINLRLQKIPDIESGMIYLKAERGDLLLSYTPEVLLANEKGADLAIIGTLIDSPLRGIICKETPEIQTPADLSSKKLGVCMDGMGQIFLEEILATQSITPSEIKNVSVDLIAALGTDHVEAIYGGFWNIECYECQALGFNTKVFKMEDLGIPPYSELIIAAKNTSSQASPSFILNFQEALQESINYCKSAPNLAFEIYLNNVHKREKVIAWERKAWESTWPLLTDTQTLNEEQNKAFLTWLLSK